MPEIAAPTRRGTKRPRPGPAARPGGTIGDAMFDGGLEPIGEADEDAMLVGPLPGGRAALAAGGRPPKLPQGRPGHPTKDPSSACSSSTGSQPSAHDNAPCALGSAAGGRLGETSAGKRG